MLDLLDKLTLTSGAHQSRDQGTCATEAVAYIAGEPHTPTTTQAPTVAELQPQALELLERMVALGESDRASARTKAA